MLDSDPSAAQSFCPQYGYSQIRSTDFGLGNLPTELAPGAEAQVTAGTGNMGWSMYWCGPG
jgi:hypothetical protein